MGRIIVNKVRGMSWTAKISLMLIFTLVFSTFMYQGWYKPIKAFAATAGPNAPVTAVDDATVGSAAWTSPGSVTASDNTYAAINNLNTNEVTHYIKATNFGFSIPAGSTITGIQVSIDRYDSGGTGLLIDSEVKLVKAGVIQATNKSTGAVWPAAEATAAFGGIADLWGGTWNDTDINNTGFGVVLSAKDNNSSSKPDPKVDYITITITYTPPVTTTLGNGTNPSNVTLAPGAAITDLDSFNFQTSSGTDSITALTVTLAAGTSAGLSEVRITSDTGATTYFTAVANPASDTVSFSLGTPITATTTLTQYKVRITPKTHANMPVPPGSTYTVTGTVTGWTGTNTKAGTDTGSATVTIDNLSPNGATATSGTAGNAKVTVNWTASNSGDFNTTSGSVIYRWAAASAGAEVPAEGSAPAIGSANGTATAACVVSSAISAVLSKIDGTGGSAECTNVALTNGQAYTYKAFQKDTNGNYDVGVSIGTFTPVAVTTTVGDGTSPLNKFAGPSATNKAVSAFTLSTSSGTDTVTQIVVTGTNTANVAASGVKIYQDNGSTPNEWDATDTLVTNGTASFAGATATFGSLSIPVTTTSTQYIITYNIVAAPTNGQTLTGVVTSVTCTNSVTNNDTTDATITIDAAAPTTTDNTPAAWQASEITVTLTPDDGTGSGVTAATGIYGCFGTACTPAVLGGTTMTTACGAGTECTYDVRYYSKDNVGNTETTKLAANQARVDRKAPAYSWNTPAAGTTYKDGGAISVDVSITEAGSDITNGATCNAKIDDATTSFTGTVTYATATQKCTGTLTLKTPSGLADGAHNLTVQVADNVANSVQSAARSINIDNAKPSVSSTVPTAGATGVALNSTVTINWSEDVNCATVNTTNITSTSPGWTFSSCSGSQALFTTSGQSNSTTYNVNVTTNVTDTVGNPMAAAYPFSYTTIAAACTRIQPTLSISPASKTINTDGGSANYTLTTITNNDTGSCADETFNLVVTDTNNTDFVTPSTLSLNPVILAPGANTNVTLSVTAQVGKTSGSNNTYVTATSANHTPQQSNTVTTTILITNPLMHNSVTLSSDKWLADGGWGIAGGKYGEFTCGTCHSPVATNIKRIATSITTPDASKGTLPGDGQTITFDRVSGTVGDPGVMGDDSDTPRDHSHRICEVCHSYDVAQTTGVNVHPYSTTDDLGNHLTADATDCTSCHKHSAAFSGAGGTCDTCHGTKPSVFWSADMNANGNAPGAHAKHFGLDAWYTLAYDDTNFTTTTYYRYNCKKCHDTGHGAALNPEIDFSGTNDPPTAGGSYASNTCSNLYCHGNFTGGLNASPTWTGTAVCGSCHGTPPSGGSHTRHAGSGAGALQVACDRCHEDTATGSSAIYDKTYHVNYYSNWNLMRTDLKLGGSAVYNSLEKGQKSPPSATYAACGSVYCHSNVQNNLGTAGPTSYGTPTWGAASVSCAEGVTGCHGNPPGTGNHVTHATTLTYVCSACHTGAGDETAAHANRLINMSIDATYGGTYTQGTHAPGSGGYGTCSNTYCHGNYIGGLNASPTWGGTAACGTCHKATNANPPTPGNHGRHAGQAAGQLNIGCAKCHPARAAKDKHQDRSVQWALDTADGKFGGSAKYNSLASGATGAKAPSGTYQTCTTTYCHSNVQNNLGTAGPTSYGTPTWGAASVSCAEGATGCHGNAPATGNHAKHMSQSGVTCSTCHSSAGDETAVHANNVINMSMSAGTYSQGNHTPGSLGYGNCTATYCHGAPATWGGAALNCYSCHQSQGAEDNTPPQVAASFAPRHEKHTSLSYYYFSCEMCHALGNTTQGNVTHAVGKASGTNPGGDAVGTYQYGEIRFRDTGASWATGAYRGSAVNTYRFRTLYTNPYGAAAPTPTYADGTAGASDTVNSNLQYSTTASSCGTIWCHSTANPRIQGAEAQRNTYRTPAWTGALTCASCHRTGNVDNYATMSGVATTDRLSTSHAKHLATDKYGPNANFTCNTCHSTVASNNATISTYANHVDGSKQVVMNVWSDSPQTGYTSATATCSTSVYCHSDGQATPTYKSITWATTSTTCASCHNYTTASGTPIITGKHTVHRTTTKMTLSAYLCADCHVDTSAANDTVSSFTKHVDKVRDVTIPGTWDSNATTTDNYTIATQTCANVYCHSSGQATPTYQPVAWTAAAMTCKSCHNYTTASGAPIITGKHTIHRTTTKMTLSAYLCADCHVSTTASADTISTASLHIQTTKARDVTVLGTWDKDATPGNNYTVATQTCTNVYCHSDGLATWTPVSVAWTAAAMTCKSCHGGTFAGGAPIIATGKHTQHINNSNLIMTDPSCNACHVDTTADNSTIATASKHIQTAKTRDVTILGTWDSNATTTDNYTVATQTCANVRCHSNGKTTGLVYNSIAWTATITGCNNASTCHALPPVGATPFDHTGKTAATCKTCHSHVNAAGDGFTTPALHINKIVEAQVTCIGCHAVATGALPRRAIVGEFGLAWGHKKSGRAAVTNNDCGVCHMEGNASDGSINTSYHGSSVGDGKIDLRDPDLGTAISLAAGYKFSRNLGSATIEGPVTTIQNFCLKCHDSTGAASASARVSGGTATNPWNDGATLVNVDAHFTTTNATFHPVKGTQNNDYCDIDTMNTPWNQFSKTVGTKTAGNLISCFDCHAASGATGIQTSTVVGHGNAVTLRATYDATAAASTKLCVVCHKQSIYWGVDGGGTANLGFTHMPGLGKSALNANPEGEWTSKGRHDVFSYAYTGCTICHGTTLWTIGGGGVLPGRPTKAINAHGFNTIADGVTATWPSGKPPYSFMRCSNNMGTWNNTGGICNNGSNMCGRSNNGTYTPGGTY